MEVSKNVLGIDAGSISISLVVMNNEKEILYSDYRFHEGHVKETLQEMLKGTDCTAIGCMALSSSCPDIFSAGEQFDNRVAVISAAKHIYGTFDSLMIIGGEKFGLALFDKEGNYLNYRSNSSCAAGTGSFLDQQAKRLNLQDIENFSRIAAENRGDVPGIASRCSVFAKTDLIHAQQEGYSLEGICDGLCLGLARNVVDTLYSGDTPAGQIVMAGGVSKNRAVVKHLEKLTGCEILIHEKSHLFGAIGVALLLLEKRAESGSAMADNFTVEDIFRNEEQVREYHYEPLELKMSGYPEFESLKSFMFKSALYPLSTEVEVDIYKELPRSGELDLYLGIDIGSTSTKSVLLDMDNEVVAGLYTRTSGRPVEAVQTIFEALHSIEESEGCRFNVLGAATTGSGRKFIGSIIGADVALDEITAHARAAYMLDPEVDTIIEIGGQDAKFTTMKNGSVTFSIMNNVCAAGTGSFIEEQAKKLGCPLNEYAARAEFRPAPLASDRCTVFMEKDLNYYLGRGFSTGEVLASVLHSVRENYLTKVAIENNIGERIFFQGATAKNRALVAAFEQRLGKPIMVSKYCHLTGALGCALHLSDIKAAGTSFRGIGIYRQSIPVRSEVCDLCTNSCKVKVAEVNGESVAFGFLCGRDYETKKFVNNSSSGFDLIKERNKISDSKIADNSNFDFTLGIPAALYLFKDLQLWKDFFALMGVKTVTSEKYKEGVREGKNISAAEFCAPMSEMHGHVAHLAGRCDYVFLPVYIETKSKEPGVRRQYCYYTQYLPPIIKASSSIDSSKILSPLLRSGSSIAIVKLQLLKMMKRITGGKINYMQVSSAYDRALKKQQESALKLKNLYTETFDKDSVNILLLGRDYTVLSRHMNKGIPDIFSRLGSKVFFQDMLPGVNDIKEGGSFTKSIHWNYASEILEAAYIAAETEGLYPVFVTSFKCTPDSYAVEYFKKIMDAYEKPYLILQLDEHDSSVGYETRIEAGVRSFRNHFSSNHIKFTPEELSVIPSVLSGAGSLTGKTLLLPRFDSILGGFMVSVLKNEGIDARLVDESRDSIQRSLSHNTGQCIPLNIIVQNCADYIKKHNLDPAKTVMWNICSSISCNLGMFPYYCKTLIESMGEGYDKVQVYAGDLTFTDISIKTSVNMYLAFMFSGMLRRMGCHIRPYEKVKGATDMAIEKSAAIISHAFRNGTSKQKALKKVEAMFSKIEVSREERPKVAVFGDLYARDNDVLNQNLIDVIERNGGEVITTPYSELAKIIADPYIRRWFKEGNVWGAVTSKILMKAISLFERRYSPYFSRVLGESASISLPSVDEVLKKFNLEIEHTGESMENALKIYSLINHYPDISLFVQTNPAFCCPSLVTEAMAGKIESVTNIPIITIEYDGTGGFKNDDIIPYLRFPRKNRLEESGGTLSIA